MTVHCPWGHMHFALIELTRKFSKYFNQLNFVTFKNQACHRVHGGVQFTNEIAHCCFKICTYNIIQLSYTVLLYI